MIYEIARSNPRAYPALEWGFFFDLFITKSRLDYAICFVQSGNTSATHGNALPFPRFPRLYKAAGEISSEEFNGEFARVVKNANARKWKKKTKKAKTGGNWAVPSGGQEKNRRNSLNFELSAGYTRGLLDYEHS